MRRTTSRKPRAARVPVKRPCDKWIVGMVEPISGTNCVRFFQFPKIHDSYDDAVLAAEQKYALYCKPFVVFAKVCVIGPSRPPVMKTEFST